MKHAADYELTSSTMLAIPSLFREASRLVDLWGTLDEYRLYPTAGQADQEAVKRDYQIVLQNLQQALREYERNRKS